MAKVKVYKTVSGDTWDLIDIALDTHGNYDGWETILVKEKSN